MVSMGILECAEVFRKGKPTDVHRKCLINLRLKD